MIGKKYVIWLDILGFDRLAKKIAEEKGVTERKVRDDFINVINERVKVVEARSEIMGKNYGERDDWILVASSLDLIFKIAFEILDHNTQYKNYEKIPLEIAVGIGEYDKWTRFDGRKLVVEESTTQFLKSRIIGYYHEWYKQNHNNESPMSTFIILTESVHHQLEPLDRKICKKIEYKYKKDDGKEEVIDFFVVDVNKVQQRGKVFEFLEKIKRPGSKLYDRIDDLYVPPIEYGEIKKALRADRIVFITGTAEYGKTYTTVRLLWEYFNQDYEPTWIPGGEERERREVRKRLEEIESELKPHRVIYFEDPFGKVRYESRESLEREIGTIIECIRNVDDVYVIITSREEVFKEFENEQLSSVEVKKFEKKLNIKKPSYNYEKRREILLGWAESKDCKWLKDDYLKDVVLEQIKDERSLPTPLSIRDFVISTINIAAKDRLMEKIEEKSKETARSFAEEIENMTEDKILFLSFPFISAFPPSLVRVEYEELVKELKVKEHWEFDRILNWFKDDKIVISEGRITFSHPSYFEALEHLLVKAGQLTWINKSIFSKVLFKLSEKDKVACEVAEAIANNFDELPEDVRNQLLLRLSQRDEVAVAWDVGRAVVNNFNKFPEDVRNQLLLRLSENNDAAEDVASAVIDNFNKLPKNVQNLLFKLLKRDKAARDVAQVVVHNFGKLPQDAQNFLFKLLESDEVAEDVFYAVVDDFGELPENVRNRLLFKLSEKQEMAELVAWAVKSHFNDFSDEARNELLLKLSKWDEAARAVALTLAANFYRLPKDVRNLLFELSKRHEVAEDVAWAVAHKFGALPEEVGNLLDKLQGHLQQIIIDLSRSDNHDKIQAIKLISKARSKLNEDFAFTILSKLLDDKNKKVRERAQKLINSMKEEHRGAINEIE